MLRIFCATFHYMPLLLISNDGDFNVGLEASKINLKCVRNLFSFLL